MVRSAYNMPQYLARNYLSEKLSSELQFLSKNLLTVPSNLEQSNNYACSLWEDIERSIISDLGKYCIDQEEHISAGKDLEITLHTGVKDLLKPYNTKVPSHSKNIIEIDSSSECGINCSYDSITMTDVDEEVYKSIVCPSLCAREYERELATNFLLEEVEVVTDFPSFSHLHVLNLCKWLRPVGLIDPFCLRSHKISTIEAIDVDKPNFHRLSFQKMQFQIEGIKMLLEETLLSIDYIEDGHMNRDEVKKSIGEFTKYEVDVESDYDLKIIGTVPCKDQVNNLLPFEMVKPGEDDSIFQIQLLSNCKILESPIPEFDYTLYYIGGKCDHLQDMKKEWVSPEALKVISPSSQSKLERRIWDEGKIFGDAHLMLLPDMFDGSRTHLLPVAVLETPLSHLQPCLIGGDYDEVLDWDPISYETDQVSAAQESLALSCFDFKKKSVTPLFNFHDVKVDNQVPDLILEDWKVEEMKLRSLQCITNCKSMPSTNDIPLTVSHQNAPFGYHKPVPQQQSKNIQNKRSVSSISVDTTPQKAYQSPLDSFLLLRTGKSNRDVSKRKSNVILPSVTNVSAVKIKPMVHNKEGTELSIEHLESSSRENGRMSMHKPSEHVTSESNVTFNTSKNIVSLQLTKDFQHIIEAVDRDSWSLLQFLKDSKRLNNNVKLLNLSTDATKFLMNEELKKKRDDGNDNDVLKGVLCLHALVQAVNHVIHCNIPSACAALKSFNHKHQDVLRNCLEPIRRKLSMFHCQLEDRGILHPKLEKIRMLLKDWLNCDRKAKILLLISSNFEFIATNMQIFLSTITNVSANLYPPMNASQSEYMETFYNSNIILALETKELESCPWQYFQYVIQYEPERETCWYQIASQENPNLKEFVSLDISLQPAIQNLTGGALLHSGTVTAEHTIICSKFVVGNQDLLIALENKESIRVLVKDYDRVNTSMKFSTHPDILVDERTAITLIPDDFLNHNTMEDLNKKILSTIIKCCVGHFIITCRSLNGSVSQDLLAFISDLISKVHSGFSHVRCKVWYSNTVEQLAEKIKIICDNAFEATEVWSKQQWNQRTWLSEDISTKEYFLMSYPFMNSYCAQILLQYKKPLKVLLSMSLENLLKHFKWLPEHILKAFYQANHSISSNVVAFHHAIPVEDYHTPVGPVLTTTVEPDSQTFHEPKALPIEEIISNNNENEKSLNNSDMFRVDKFKHASNNIDFVKKSSVSIESLGANFKFMPQSNSTTFDDRIELQVGVGSQKYKNHGQSFQTILHPNQKITHSIRHPSSNFKFQLADFDGNCMNDFSNTVDCHPNLNSTNFSIDIPKKVFNSASEFTVGSNSNHSQRQNNFGSKPTKTLEPYNYQHLETTNEAQDFQRVEHFYQQTKSYHDAWKQDGRNVHSVSYFPHPGQNRNQLNGSIIPYGQHMGKATTNNSINNPLWNKSNQTMKIIPRQVVQAFNVNNKVQPTSCQPRHFGESGKGFYNAQNEILIKTPAANIRPNQEMPRSVSMLGAKKRRLTYERVPGATNGQTRLTFL